MRGMKKYENDEKNAEMKKKIEKMGVEKGLME